jgi:hypothetical protein
MPASPAQASRPKQASSVPGRCPERMALRAAETRGPWVLSDRLTRACQ